ncbi:MAG: gluconolaconase [Bryobacteraceae bacterium]|jgi:sugar lactone lactonase YvrE
MAFRKNSEPRPQILTVSPAAAIPGGEFQIRGKGLAVSARPSVRFGEVSGPIVIGSDSFVIVRVPEGAPEGAMTVGNDHASVPWTCGIGIQVADGLHPVSNPVIDQYGNIYSTFSGSPGQKTPVSIYKIDTNFRSKPLVTDLMNATGLAFDREGALYASSRHDGIVYQVSPSGSFSVYVEGMGVATGIAFDPEGNLYVGDRSGTVFKISRQRQIYVFATLEPSIAAYHLAFGPDGYLYVTGPTTSSFDAVHRISHDGHVELFYRGLGRPQGMAFDAAGNLYVAASLGGRRGVVRITPETEAELFLSGPAIVGLAFSPSKSLILATNNSLYRVDVGIEGRRIP